MNKPLTSDLVLKHPILYRNAPNIREADVADALNGFKTEIWGLTEITPSMKEVVFQKIDAWFPAFKKQEEK